MHGNAQEVRRKLYHERVEAELSSKASIDKSGVPTIPTMQELKEIIKKEFQQINDDKELSKIVAMSVTTRVEECMEANCGIFEPHR